MIRVVQTVVCARTISMGNGTGCLSLRPPPETKQKLKVTLFLGLLKRSIRGKQVRDEGAKEGAQTLVRLDGAFTVRHDDDGDGDGGDDDVNSTSQTSGGLCCVCVCECAARATWRGRFRWWRRGKISRRERDSNYKPGKPTTQGSVGVVTGNVVQLLLPFL